MKYVRYAAGGKIGYGILEDERVEAISTTPFLPYERTGELLDPSGIRLLAPCLPSKIVAIGVNYRDHASEMGRELPDVPMCFFKPSSAVIGPEDNVVRPPGCEELHYEGELAVVIGALARRVSPEDWQQAVLGYTCSLDMTARDLQRKDLQWARAKGFDTSAPLGPAIATGLDPSNLGLTTRVRGEVRQKSRTDQLIFDVGFLVSFVTAYITLLPGDVIMTGTPAGVGEVQDDDRIEVEIEGIGTLGVGVRS